MRKLSLFVHTPVLGSLEPGIAALSTSENFAVHTLKLDAELFPLLLEARPCVILASVEDQSASNELYQLMKELKIYRVSQGFSARDASFRVVIVTEGQMPRLNWAHLGIYELMIGPVLPNVLAYKLSRHYQKALLAENNDEVYPPQEEIELKPVESTPEWRVFKRKEAIETQKQEWKPEEALSEKVTVKLKIPQLIDREGQWEEQEDAKVSEGQWDWENKIGTGSMKDPVRKNWSFSGSEEPIFNPEDGTWEFTGKAPKLSKVDPKTKAEEVIFEYHPKKSGESEAQMKARPEIEVKSVRTQKYRAHSSQTQSEEKASRELLDRESRSEGQSTSSQREAAQERFGKPPKLRDQDEEALGFSKSTKPYVSPFTGSGAEPKKINETEGFSASGEKGSSLNAQGASELGHSNAQSGRVSADSNNPILSKSKNTSEEAGEAAALKKRRQEFGSAPTSSAPGEDSLNEPFLKSREAQLADLKSTGARSAAETLSSSLDNEKTTRDRSSRALMNENEEPSALRESQKQNSPNLSRSGDTKELKAKENKKSRASLESEEIEFHQKQTGNKPELAIRTEADPRNAAGKNLSLKKESAEDEAEDFYDQQALQDALRDLDTVIPPDANDSSLSILFDDALAAKNLNAKNPEAVEPDFKDWNFKLVKKASRQNLKPRSGALQPQSDLSVEEKRSLFARIIRFILSLLPGRKTS